MDIDGYTTVGFRTRSTNSVKRSYDVGMLLPDKIHYWTAYYFNEPKVSGSDRYNHQTDRSVESGTVGCKQPGYEC